MVMRKLRLQTINMRYTRNMSAVTVMRTRSRLVMMLSTCGRLSKNKRRKGRTYRCGRSQVDSTDVTGVTERYDCPLKVDDDTLRDVRAAHQLGSRAYHGDEDEEGNERACHVPMRVAAEHALPQGARAVDRDHKERACRAMSACEPR